MADAKAGRIPKSKVGKPWLADQKKASKQGAKIPLEAFLNITDHPEETGGGVTIVLSDDDDDDDSEFKVGSSAAGRKLRRGLKKISRKTKRMFESPFKRQQQAPRPQPQRRTELGPKFIWGNYVALSYEWGEGPSDQQISITNCSASGERGPEASFYVRQNLYAALRRLRLMPQFVKGCRLWADFICINQKDIDERDAQMEIMSSIYQRAGNVLVWLGEGNETLYKALDDVQFFSTLYRTEFQEAYDDVDQRLAFIWRNSAAVKMKMILSSLIDWSHNTEPLYSDLLDAFFSLRYWRRLWMIQELVTGTADMALVLGDRVTEWRYIRDAVFIFAAIRDAFAGAMSSDVQDNIVHIAKIAQLERETHRKFIQPPLDMDSLLQMTTHFHNSPTSGPQRGDVLWQAFKLISYAKCFDPKDRVFGILALPCLPDLRIEHDSKKSIVKVYEEFAVACMN
ncbi:uncharacterized protein RCC_06755 [Ramularia collo-cygni]|uniref:Heterokaryon incompatibility domain-containing protein n=1 Tax=Ramularia collo-cygni TaxID=112498 RepID=A0A2D3V2F6_9PEZI|nr:uncharacterized protein RCC_06755 [Ramularia collo-cygni]CZT20895.1 uncharacterized protein RCC_06755 [Ramularia collo-cygni]